MKTITLQSQGFKLFGRNYFCKAEAPTILLLHGLGFYSFEYEELAQKLMENSFNCLTFDFRCHGRSEGPRGQWMLRDLIQDTVCALNYIEKNMQGPIGIFGNSLGAVVAIYTAAKDTRIKSIVSSNCTAKPSEAFFNPFLTTLLYLALGIHLLIPIRLDFENFVPIEKGLSDPDWIAKIKADEKIREAHKISPKTYYEMYRFDAVAEIKKVKAPILIIQGEKDNLQPPEQSKILFESANEPKKLLMTDTGHQPNLENTQELCGILTDWFHSTLVT